MPKNVFLAFTIAAVGMFACSIAIAGPVGILVPAYFYPGTGGPGGVGDGWAAMDSAASQVPITAILNPNSGPGSSVDPNYVSAATDLEAAGGKVIGYIYTDNGATALSTVESQASTYISQYGNLINGFFIDGSLIDSSTLSYYQSIDNYIHGLNSTYTVVSNPGQPYLNGVTPQQYLSTANVFNIFEGPNVAPSTGSAGFNDYPYGQTWYQSYPATDFSNIITGVTSQSVMQSDVSSAVGLGADTVYVADSSSYANLPSYWTAEVATIASINSVSAPSGLLLLGLAFVGLFAIRKRGLSNQSGLVPREFLAPTSFISGSGLRN